MEAATLTQPKTSATGSAPVATPLTGMPDGNLHSPDPIPVPMAKATLVQFVGLGLGLVAFLYFARPVMLPIFLACAAAMTLKPLIRWLSYCHIPPALSAAVVLCGLVFVTVIGFLQLGRPALAWLNEAPQHMTELRQRVQKLFPRLARFSLAATAMTNLGATEAERQLTPTVEVNDNRSATALFNWTGSFMVGAGETLVLLYLLLASGDLFLQKLVRVMPTMHDKKSAVEISHDIQHNISNYLFSVTFINLCLGLVVSGGLYLMGVPNAAMWGMVVAILNFVPYFGPIAGVMVLAAAGLLTFDTLAMVALPPAWYLLLHLLEANLVTPLLLGRRFTLNPVVIFVSLIFWTWLWGVPGAILSVPILVAIKAVCDRVRALSQLNELLTR
jgi:predicted PurR-regulated permease PerM